MLTRAPPTINATQPQIYRRIRKYRLFPVSDGRNKDESSLALRTRNLNTRLSGTYPCRRIDMDKRRDAKYGRLFDVSTKMLSPTISVMVPPVLFITCPGVIALPPVGHRPNNTLPQSGTGTSSCRHVICILQCLPPCGKVGNMSFGRMIRAPCCVRGKHPPPGGILSALYC